MSAVWYIGTSDKRIITSGEWTAAGSPGATSTWEASNGWSLPQAGFTAGQLAILSAHSEFVVNAADGPRPNSAVPAAAAPFLKASDLDALGIGPTQTRRKFEALKPELRGTIMDPRLGPATTDISTLVLNAAGDGATYNRQYGLTLAPHTGMTTGNALPDTWPADMGEGVPAYVSNFQAGWGSQNFMPRSIRFHMDGDKFCWYAGAGNSDFLLYVDDRPVAIAPTGGSKDTLSNAYRSGNASAHFNIITFPSKKLRKIEIRTAGYIQALYTQKPYDLFRPPPRRGPRVLVIGDSFTASLGATWAMNSAYWDIGPHIGSEDVWVDQIGGTGYGVTSVADGSGTGNRYIDRIERLITVNWRVADINPDMIVVHGGGANDKYKLRSNAQCIADVTTMFTNLRAVAPNAKLVFVEGFAPPTGFSGFNADYIAIRAAAQAALAAIGVTYINVATLLPWIKGTGYNSTGDATENSYAYISSDGVHPNDAGHLYIRQRMGQRLRRVLYDDGSLLNALV